MHNVERELDRYLTALRNLIRQRGFTQLEVQEALGWGRSYVSQLLTKQKGLRFEQVPMILNTIGVTPEEYLSEIYPPLRRSSGNITVDRPHKDADAPSEPEATLADEMQRLNGLMRGLVSLLQKKGRLTTAELAQAVEEARHEP